MNMTFLQSIAMGFVSGLAELLPISAEAHRAVLRCLMGQGSESPLLALLVHLGALAALCRCCRRETANLRRAGQLLRVPPRKRKTQPDMADVYTLRLLNTATVLLVAGRLFTNTFTFVLNELHLLGLNLIICGVVLLIPRLCRSGNKDSRNMPRLDGLLMGLAAGLSVVPGFSLVGMSCAVGAARGVDRRYALRFTWQLLLRGLLISLVFDLLGLIAGGLGGLTLMTGAGLALAGVFAFVGGLLGYKIMEFMSHSSDVSPFSYYCFGAGLFTLILFLLT